MKYFKIRGDSRVELSKRQNLRLLRARLDLEGATEAVDALIFLLDEPGSAERTLDAMGSHALALYGRNFGPGGVLMSDLFDTVDPLGTANSERHFHLIAMQVRTDMLCASDQFLKMSEIWGAFKGDEFVTAPSVSTETIEDKYGFYMCLMVLIQRCLDFVDEQAERMHAELSRYMESGAAQLGRESVGEKNSTSLAHRHARDSRLN